MVRSSISDSPATTAEHVQFAAFAVIVAAAIPLLLRRIFITPIRRRFPATPNTGRFATGSRAAVHEAHLADGSPMGDVLTGGSAPVIGLILCLLYTLRFNFHSTVRVEGPLCNPGDQPTPQFMPSISASIGDHAPQRYIWRIAICFMIVNRITDGAIQRSFFARVAAANVRDGASDPKTSTYFGFLNGFVYWTHTLEQFALVLLSYVSSSDWRALHEMGFIGFGIFNVLHMCSTMLLLRAAYGDRLLSSPRAALGWKLRKRWMAFNFGLLALAACLFVRHVTYCEPYVYSFFGVCEWLFVATNILFLNTWYIDAAHARIVVVDDVDVSQQHLS